jgi:YegS/Rv2252/BmrU family lipid kinase
MLRRASPVNCPRDFVLMKLLVVVNPRAGAGAATRRAPILARTLKALGVQAEFAETQGPRDATRIAREGRDRFDCIAALGGDGTLNELVQAYVAADGSVLEGPELAVFPAGTGGDFRKTFDVPDDVAIAAERVVRGAARPLDLGVVSLTGERGEPVTRAFINITSFGLGGLTDRLVNESPKWMGGKAAFFMGALRALALYKNAPVVVTVDGRSVLEAPVLNVAIANGRYFGGGMKIAPDADPADGLFDVVALYDLTRAQGIGLAYKIYQGTHPGSPGVRVARGEVVEAAPAVRNAEVLIDLDGETPGRLPLRAHVAHHALRVRI